MNISIQQVDLLTIPCDLLVVSLFEGVTDLGGATGAVDAALNGDLSRMIRQDAFKGKLGEMLSFPTFGRLKAKKVCVLGLGKRQVFDADAVRKAGGFMIRAAKSAKASRIATILHGAGIAGLKPDMAACALGEGMRLGAYEFREHFGTAERSKQRRAVKEIVIVESDPAKARLANAGLAKAHILAEATIVARDLVNTSPRHMHPAELAAAARRLAKRGSGIGVRVFDRVAMERMGMEAALAVADGSDHPPAFVHAVYRPTKRAKKRVVFVGKAITFDSGGLNVKTGDGMTNMKIDMAGAASIIGCLSALAALKIPVEVHGIFAALENMPSGHAYRPGDVVRAMNGMTIEILNTDAEGRVTMADSLSYAVRKIKPDAIVDLATLTGAVIVALGDDYAALMANDRALARTLLVAARASGELLWELPLPESYDEALHSKVADMNNTGGRSAGVIKGGLFLKRFVGDMPWAHLDIAGPVFCEKETRPDIPYGGTGYGVRTLISYLEGLGESS